LDCCINRDPSWKTITAARPPRAWSSVASCPYRCPFERIDHARMAAMEQPDPDVLDAVLSLSLAVAAGDEDAVEVFLRSHDREDLTVAGAHVIWRMAAALGQMVEPKRSPPQMIHVFAQALREETPS
jgi:hypothetical protein